ncbi:hypothetical protein RRG08_015870, partial [Elysia crispata]
GGTRLIPPHIFVKSFFLIEIKIDFINLLICYSYKLCVKLISQDCSRVLKEWLQNNLS